MQNEAYQKLMDNLCDIVAEEQAKLGYIKGRTGKRTGA